jgi:beta-N-acetylhexosaminidase
MTINLGQHFLAALDGLTITPEVKHLIEVEHVLGFTLFRRNITDAEQLTNLNCELQALANQVGYQLILAVDQEGGRVFRLPEPFSQILPMREWGKLAKQTGNNTYLRDLGQVLGLEIQAAGFNLNFAPVVDVDTNPNNPIIGDRSFASDGESVAKLAEGVILGLLDTNVIPCLKHFPGHGDTSLDSHLDLPTDGRSLSALEACDLIPYRQLIKAHLAPTLMTAHVLYPALDSQHPATLSEKILTGLLRTELGYTGVIFSDDLLMKAIADRYKLADAARQFFLAGGDVALVCQDPALAISLIEQTRKSLSENTPEAQKLTASLTRSNERLTTLKTRYLKPGQSLSLAMITAKHKEFLKKIFAA